MAVFAAFMRDVLLTKGQNCLYDLGIISFTTARLRRPCRSIPHQARSSLSSVASSSSSARRKCARPEPTTTTGSSETRLVHWDGTDRSFFSASWK